MIKLELTEEQFGNLVVLVTAGAKSSQIDHRGLMIAGSLLYTLEEAARRAQASAVAEKAAGP